MKDPIVVLLAETIFSQRLDEYNDMCKCESTTPTMEGFSKWSTDSEIVGTYIESYVESYAENVSDHLTLLVKQRCLDPMIEQKEKEAAFITKDEVNSILRGRRAANKFQTDFWRNAE